MHGGNILSATMRATIYVPPSKEFPHLAVVFHTDGTILLARPFASAEEASQYVADVSSSLVAIGATYDDVKEAKDASTAEPASEGELSLD